MSDKKKPEEIELSPDDAEKAGDGDGTSRRDFLRSLGKWSTAIIGAVVVGGLAAPPETGAWVNRRGSWINRRGGWINRGGSWINRGGGSWINRRGF